MGFELCTFFLTGGDISKNEFDVGSNVINLWNDILNIPITYLVKTYSLTYDHFVIKQKIMAKKYYVVWKGRKTGIYESWDECNKQVKAFAKAQYMSYPTIELAKSAFANGYENRKNPKGELNSKNVKVRKPIAEAILVDGAWSTSTGHVEYQGLDATTKKIIFHVGPLDDGTNNIAEFLAIVHALVYCRRKHLSIPIYSDSTVAIGWVRKKKARTNHPRTEKNTLLFEAIERATNWLRNNDYPNEILKWETKVWGENPADFGRK